MRFYGTIFLVSAAAVGTCFWHMGGNSLQYGIYGAGGLLWNEDFSTEFRVGFTAFIAVLAAAFCTWLLYAFRTDYLRPAISNGRPR